MLFSKVLIANRGEIAVRIIKACRRLSLQSVAIFSDADSDAPFVALADEAINVGPPEARSSYLDVERILDAARQTGAQAIHPGYGFLAENAAFARRCEEAGIIFVGPPPAAIAAMGGKIQAKRIAAEAGVACVPGYHGDDQSDTTLQREASRIGTPLLIKASAGGGGRGMRRIDDLGTFLDNLAIARQEARAAFGDPSLLLERYIEAPRHIEVQVLADQHGNVRHLFERDCSVQRNYQKIIEEAPAPNLDGALRAQILADAVRLATAIDYQSAGTLEFVVDARTNAAYFLEMNTRLQVEHPVTEAVTGLDIVEWQLRIAGGEALPFSQADVRCDGWAIEARVAAEDPAAGYRAQTGVITAYREPQSANVRVDSGVTAGSTVSPYYDSMLAKVIARGRDRPSAIRELRQALASFRIAGVRVNTAFLRDVLALPEFHSGSHQTGCLAGAFPDGWSPAPPAPAEIAIAALIRHLDLERPGFAPSPWSALGAWRIGEPGGRRGAAYYHLRAATGAPASVKVIGRQGAYALELDGQPVLEVRDASWDGQRLAYTEASRRHRVEASLSGTQVCVFRPWATHAMEVLTAEQHLLADARPVASGDGAVLAPTPGLISEVLVAVGEHVEAAQPVAIFESMKLLQQLRASVSGIVKAIACRAGDTVAGGDLLIALEPDTKAPEANADSNKERPDD
ncbi:MAG: acetyl/propionyl-CoA carboxylase subunit alpha [Reyranella sp.]|nr:acetyl/propionyl-CoA carboxylase subunit alpha [Reyranella sp.]